MSACELGSSDKDGVLRVEDPANLFSSSLNKAFADSSSVYGVWEANKAELDFTNGSQISIRIEIRPNRLTLARQCFSSQTNTLLHAQADVAANVSSEKIIIQESGKDDSFANNINCSVNLLINESLDYRIVGGLLQLNRAGASSLLMEKISD